MPRSMTGYGAVEGPLAGGHLAIEIRTVNHRHFSAQIRVPPALQFLEPELRNRLRRRIERGQVSLTARWTDEPPDAARVRVNIHRARAIVRALEDLQATLDLPGQIDLTFVARQPDVLTTGEPAAVEVGEEDLSRLLDHAIDELTDMREGEGRALANELERLLTEMETHLDRVTGRAPERLGAERERLRRSVRDLLDGASPNEERLAQEIALLADKLDITEELVRLRTHMRAFRTMLEENGAVGRRLAFLGQEMLRETNTIGSKANDAEITQSVVAIKGELEKLREQVENLE